MNHCIILVIAETGSSANHVSADAAHADGNTTQAHTAQALSDLQRFAVAV